MKALDRRFLSGVGLTAALAAGALALTRLPGIAHLGPLTIALLLGMAWRAIKPPPESWSPGIAFSARTLLRTGIILLGVRLNLDLVLHAGPRILLIDASVITVGLIGITWVGRRFGLDPTLACLIAVDNSICGASAVAAAAPTLRAREDEMALVIPMCSVIGTVAVLGFTLAQHFHPFSTLHYGMITGATLPEVAQVMAAVNPVPGAVEVGTITKLTRVVLLVPVVFILALWMARQRHRQAVSARNSIPKPWFVLGFLGVGVANTVAFRAFPNHAAAFAIVDAKALGIANVMMSMSMAGMGLQVDFAQLRANGVRTMSTALIGWIALTTFAAAEMWLLHA